ncbi:hypothetical protein dsx2_2386 [Desulfovibrio sp. X2]|uniref:hypothetical protein n=1 Tax=Desulfovibrio sp. X2 TaxID=941449 RepID=UPI000358B5E0|nr:hypothetical protein [Desulfovibrio sp. X2]EPR43535.1 hypothetical protein dsx2_2386 [Desulfovibrio sp. X2]
MEKALLKLARQLNAYDEASLMSLWDKYSEIVQNFEPSKRWEEAVIALSMIQGMRFKNQLFNYHWAQSQEASGHAAPPAVPPASSLTPLTVPGREGQGSSSGSAPSGPGGRKGSGKGGKVIRLTPRED